MFLEAAGGAGSFVGLLASANGGAAALAAVAALGATVGPAIWCLLVASWLTAWATASQLAGLKPADPLAARLVGLCVPLLFGAWILVLWEALVTGLGVPAVLLPAPSAIGARLAGPFPLSPPTFSRLSSRPC